MIGRRRKADVHQRRSTFPIEELIGQLEGGSTIAHERLLALAARPMSSPPDSGPGPASQSDPSPSMILDRIAASAAAGSAPSLTLLIGLISANDLAGPAIRRLATDAPVVEDIEQEVLLAVSRSIDRFRGEAKFTTWLYALTRNVGVSHLRRLRPTVPLTENDRLHDGADRRLSSVVARREALRRAMETLPPQLRDAVVLRDIEGLSYAEIAERQGLEVSTVRSRLSRGRAMLAPRVT